MGRRHRESGEDITNQLAPLIEDDEFLTALSRGEDPTGGEDPLAGLLLELRGDVEKQMPPAPVIEGAEELPAVIPMSTRRRRTGPLLHGLIGAAAATVAIVGVGAALTSTGLIGTSVSENSTAVELASTLDELDRSTANGDEDSTRELLEEARRLVGKLDAADTKSATRSTAPRASTVTVTATAPAPEPSSAEPAPAETITVTEAAPTPEQPTVTQYATVTETVVRENPLPPGEDEPTPAEPPADGGLTPPQRQQ